MSDSSEDEDNMSKFKEAVDNSFMKQFTQTSKPTEAADEKTSSKTVKSEKYLEEASHYNDVKVPKEMQKKIGDKVSALIEKKIKFVEVKSNDKVFRSEPHIIGGVRLFRNSSGFLSCEDVRDTYTEKHNSESKKMKRERKRVKLEDDIDESEKIKVAAVTGEVILSKKDTRFWKSRRKEKVYKYKTLAKTSILLSID